MICKYSILRILWWNAIPSKQLHTSPSTPECGMFEKELMLSEILEALKKFDDRKVCFKQI